MIDWLTTITQELTTLARLVVILIAVVSVAYVWYQTKALVPTLGSILLAAIAIWATSPAGITQLQNWIGADAAQAQGAITVEVTAGPSLGPEPGWRMTHMGAT